MALVLKDRVQETSTTTGTGTITLGGAVAGYQSFAASTPSGSIVYYCIAAQTGTDWEVGYGTFTSPDQLSRTSVLSSSNSSSLVNFPAGTKNVFVTQPAEKAVYQETNGDVLIPSGVLTVIGANATNPTFTATLGEFVSNIPTFSQLFAQNQSNNANASTDIVSYNNLGDGTNYFVDMGITSSTYNEAAYPIFQANDAYLYNGGNTAGAGASGDISRLLIGTSTANSNVVIFGGSVNVNAVIATFVASTKDVNFANNISVTSNVSANNGVFTTGAYVSSNTALITATNQVTSKAYVDAAVATGFVVHDPVNLATVAALSGTPTYNNGTAGVGATLTASGVGTLSVDGQNAASGFRILVQSQANAAHNGVYSVTTEGTGGAAYVLTRSTDFDTASAGEIANNAYFFVTAGDTLIGHSYVLSQLATITVGTTALPFTEFAAQLTYTGTAPINVSGQTIALTGIVPVANGGTNLSSYTTGDVVYANATNTLTRRAIGASNTVLVSNGSVPDWGTVALGSASAVSGTLGPTNGGTGQSTYILGDIVYANGTNTLAKLAGQITTTQKFLSQTGNGVNSAAPVWDTIPAGSITGLGTMSTQNANAVTITGGTLNNVIIGGTTANAGTFTTANATTFNGSGAGLTTLNGSNISSGTVANARTTAATANGASTIVLRDAGGNFAANTITANLTGTASTATTATTATTANNIAGGAAGGIPYQTGSGTTTILATGTGVLVGGTTPAYSTAPTLTGTNFTSIPNSATTASAANGASTIVARDINGSFTANLVTATTFSGSGASLTALNGSNISSGTVANARTTAASANGASTIVTRDASGNFAANVITATLTGSATTAATVTNAAQANITSVGTLTSLTSSGTIQSTGTGTANLTSSGDIYASRSGGTTGVIFFGNSGIKYLYFDGTNYLMPGGQLDVNGQRVLNAGNYNSYAPTLTGTGASGTWGISISGSAATATSATTATTATTATNLSGGTVSATTVQATGGFTATSAAPFYTNATTVSSNYTVQTNFNAMSAGPITINTGVTVTVSTGSSWVIV